MIEQAPLSIEVEKPWGKFEQYTHNSTSTVKIITVAPGGSLSRQYHHKRDELWVVLDSGVRVELGGKVLDPVPGEKLFILRGTVHRLSCPGEHSVRIMEISFGEFDENDIVRLEDVYGRVEKEAPSVTHSTVRLSQPRSLFSLLQLPLEWSRKVLTTGWKGRA